MGKFLDFSKLDKGPNPNYFGEHIFVNGSSWNEVAPRVTQIKNFLGITDGKTLMTPESLRQGFESILNLEDLIMIYLLCIMLSLTEKNLQNE